MEGRSEDMTDWTDIGSICRTFAEERTVLDVHVRQEPRRNFWKEAADEIEQLRATIKRLTARE